MNTLIQEPSAPDTDVLDEEASLEAGIISAMKSSVGQAFRQNSMEHPITLGQGRRRRHAIGAICANTIRSLLRQHPEVHPSNETAVVALCEQHLHKLCNDAHAQLDAMQRMGS